MFDVSVAARGVVAQDGSQAVSGSGVRLPQWLMIARSPGCGFVLGKMSESGYASVGFTIVMRRRSWFVGQMYRSRAPTRVATSAESARVSRSTSLPKRTHLVAAEPATSAEDGRTA
jgi:hypothetical protein